MFSVLSLRHFGKNIIAFLSHISVLSSTSGGNNETFGQNLKLLLTDCVVSDVRHTTNNVALLPYFAVHFGSLAPFSSLQGDKPELDKASSDIFLNNVRHSLKEFCERCRVLPAGATWFSLRFRCVIFTKRKTESCSYGEAVEHK